MIMKQNIKNIGIVNMIFLKYRQYYLGGCI